jgi:hypothetical protein
LLQGATRKTRRKKKRRTYRPNFFCKKSQKARPIFFIVFLNCPHRETPKNVIKLFREKNGFGLLVKFFVKTFRHDFFKLPSLKNTRKCDKTKKVEEKLTSKFLSKCWEKFSTRTFCQNIFMVFSNSPCRETPKNVLKKTATKKKKREVPTYLIYHLPDIRRFHFFLFFGAPRLVGFVLYIHTHRPAAQSPKAGRGAGRTLTIPTPHLGAFCQGDS